MKRYETKGDKVYRLLFNGLMTFGLFYFGAHILIHIINK